MSNFCEAMDNWDDLSTDERFELVSEFIEDYLVSQGYEVNGIEKGHVPDVVDPNTGEVTHKDGSYDPDTGVITYDEAMFEETDAMTSYRVGIHEAEHAVWREELGESHPDYDEQDYDDLHEIIEDYSEEIVTRMFEECVNRPVDDTSSESPAEKNLPEEPSAGSPAGDWNLPSEDTRHA